MHTVWDESGRSAPLSAGRGRRLAAMAALCAAGLTLAAPRKPKAWKKLRAAHAAAAADAERAGQVNAAKAAAEAQRDAAQKELEALRGQLARAQGQAEKLSQQQSAVLESAQSQIAASNAQLGKFKGAYDELLVLARTKESERAKLAGALAQRDEQVKSCVAKNREMYQAGKDILNAYERVSTGDMMAMRQPFARSARVKFEEQAQEYGDKLYDAQIPASAAMQAQTK